ncbi:hypothetical protein SAMN04487964_10758 [Marinobacterium sediminicola]|uniref:Penicillin-binding protein activator n=1 Tax=Marinobacterium sediminicola TaxID=518898 RepID=A0ABY1S0R0_9GAMM|nr:hypothetical protein SAMN04487964_10758 [Marinobacterium sediminicola]
MLFWGALLFPLSTTAEDGVKTDRLRQLINAAGVHPSASSLEPVWRALQELPIAQLIELSRQDSNNYFEQGWFELARDYRLVTTSQQDSRLDQWQARWFHHPAKVWLPYLKQAVPRASVPDRVERLGVLLPLSGQFAEQGREVLAGMRAALEWDRRQGYAVPQLQIHDTGAVEELPEFLSQLAEEGAPDLLVGPLRPELTQQLTRMQSVPVLALNRAGGEEFNGYQLDLASDQELRQLIKQIRQDGHRRVLLLAPADEAWVEPLLAWIEQLSVSQELVIQDRLRYEATPERLSWQLGQVLGVNASRERAQQLAQLLPEAPKQEARHRRDIDAVLLIARPDEARLVKPILNYHRADALPVYAGSHLFTGKVDAIQDRDLEGIVFCDMPWRLRQRPGRSPSSSFFALGLDAGSVYRALPQMRAGASGYFEGETGHLRLVRGHRLQRSLPCARFVRGEPRLITTAD